MLALTLTGCAAHHRTRGVVLQVDPASATLTVSHDAIPGYMEAMVMPFAVASPALLADVRPGDRVELRITERKGRTSVDQLTLLSAKPTDAGMLLSPARPSAVHIGQPVADFTLTDHRGEEVALRSLRGKVVLIAFVYTRCPLPDYCPRMVANLRAVARRFEDRSDLALLTITFDPKYDTPEKLAAYARQNHADRSGWHFLTGTSEQIARVCSLFGIDFWPEQGLITHTLQTAVIARDGRLAAKVEGKDYSDRQLGDLVARVLNN